MGFQLLQIIEISSSEGGLQLATIFWGQTQTGRLPQHPIIRMGIRGFWSTKSAKKIPDLQKRPKSTPDDSKHITIPLGWCCYVFGVVWGRFESFLRV